MPDPTAQEEFVRLLTSEQSAIHSFITSLMPGNPSVDDVLQRTNLVLWRKCDGFTLGTNFRAWAFRCASWQVRAFFKDQKSRNWLVFDEELTDLLAAFQPGTGIPVLSVDYDTGTAAFTVVFTSEDDATYSVYGGTNLQEHAAWPGITGNCFASRPCPPGFGP